MYTGKRGKRRGTSLVSWLMVIDWMRTSNYKLVQNMGVELDSYQWEWWVGAEVRTNRIIEWNKIK